MTEKLHEYQGLVGRFHQVRDDIKEKFIAWKENRKAPHQQKEETDDLDDYSHIFRKKSRKELIRTSAAVMGIEFSYAAETAFVSPTLLKIGVQHEHMTLVWAVSPLIGFFLTPILGSLSDGCRLEIGRRRPFIICLSIGVLLGLFLVPNGEAFGYLLGDEDHTKKTSEDNSTSSEIHTSHPWGVFFTVLGTALLDFDADACQSPARAYLLDVTIPEDHARGLSTFTIMAGLGGFLGYALGGINWDATAIGEMLGGHVRAVFTLITIIFVICVSYTVTSFKEMPLDLLQHHHTSLNMGGFRNESFESEHDDLGYSNEKTYGTLNDDEMKERHNKQPRMSLAPNPNASLRHYLKSIIYMPRSIRMLCLTNLVCWMAHVCYSLYFTDFVGEAVFDGDPLAPEFTESRERYEAGVRFGCWGMSMYSLSCACYSTIIERLISRFGAKRVYIGGLLTYSGGMFLMALTKNKFGVILFSWTAGVMYSTLFTMPYLLVAHYHARSTFDTMDREGDNNPPPQIRGLGTDVGLVSSMVFLAQFILSLCMGTIVTVSGTTTAVVSVASVLAFCGAGAATQIMYLDL
ncbi:proton-associated sugar transporter A [Sitophilus oryzae]|uniref:Proton-associated sugar transporter A n=1 Tax=Sitophilus oryzae TaxID=7048 RepID=A0A6J2X946_SITOR|nr:proton-associated sugar transporter A [Sitophilus oryzae]